MRAKTITITICFLLAAFLGEVKGQDYGVEVRLTSQKLIKVEPGRIVTASYVISNSTDRTVELLESIDLPIVPNAWQSLTAKEYHLVLGVNEQKVRLLTLIVPKDCPPGKYDVTYLLTDLRYNDVKATESFSVVVLPVVKFDALVEEKPEVVMAGDEYKVCLRLVNQGNSKTAMKLTTSGSPNYPTALDNPEVTLEPRSSQLVNILVTTDAGIRNKKNHVLMINTEATIPGHDVVGAENTVFVEILPRLAEAVDPRHRVPTKIRFIAVGDRDDDGFQMEYSGSGSYDEAGNRRIDFLLRGPDVKDRSIYGTRDILRFNYYGQLLDFQVGDNVYSISPLAERLIYGRGGRVSIHNDEFEIGSIYLETRWDVPEKQEIGAYSRYSLNDKLHLKGNYLNKRRRSSASVDSYETNIYTLQASIRPDPRFNLGLEYGYSFNDKEYKPNDLAHRITLDGRIKNQFWYIFENTYAGTGFLGYYNDVLYSSGSLAFPIYRNLSGNLSYRLYENNLDIDPAKSTATREQSYRGVLSYATASGTNLSLDYEAFRREDRLTPSQYNFEEDIWRLGIGHSFRGFSFQTYSERANFVNELEGGRSETLERYSMYAYFHPSSKHSYSVFTRIGHNSFTGTPVWTKSIGVSMSLSLRNFLNVSLNYQKNNINSENLMPQDYLFSTIEFTLPKKHTLFLRTRWFKLQDSDTEDYSFLAAYTIPLSIPAGKKRSFGILKGKVFDRDGAATYPLKDVALSVDGMSTVTNQKGEFMFPSLKPGTYSLRVDQKSIGFERTTAKPLPMLVEVEGGETTIQEIGVLTASEIYGRVVLYALNPEKALGGQRAGEKTEFFVMGSGETRSGSLEDDEVIEHGGLSHILVEISNGDEILRQRTDEKGSFSFDRLRPGTWRLKVYKQGLPLHHYLEKEEFEIELTKNERKEIKVKILPKLRSVRIIEEGKIN